MSNEEIRSKIEESLKKVALKLDIINHDIKIKYYKSNTSEVIHLAIKRAFDKSSSDSFMDTVASAYDNEIFFYEELIPTLDKFQKEAGTKEPFTNVAKCYYTQKDLKSKLLVFEDINKSGFQLFDKTKLFPSDHQELIFRKYAKFHALSFVYKKRYQNKFSKLSSKISDVFQDFLTDPDLISMMKQGGKDIVQCFDPDEDKEIYQQVKKYGENLMELLKGVFDYNGGYSCLLQGDCWSNNMMFKYHKNGKVEDMRILDFQLIKEGCPVHDLSYFFYSSSSTEDQNKFEHYLNLYHTELSKFILELGENPEEIYTIEALKMDWRIQSKYGLMMAAVLQKAKLTKKEDLTDSTVKEESSDKLTSSLSELLAKAVYDEDEYKKRIRGLVKHVYSINAL